MFTFDLYDLQKAIYQEINIDAVLDMAQIFDYIPEGEEFPFIVIGDDRADELNTKTLRGYTTTSNIYVWGEEKSMKQVKQLLKIMCDSLNSDLGDFEFIGFPEISANREMVDYVKGTLVVKYEITED